MKNLIICVLATYILSTLQIWESKPLLLPVGMFMVSAICVYCTDWYLQERRERRNK